jgi:threonine dehydratase
VGPNVPNPFRCPNEGSDDDTDHVLTRVIKMRTVGNKAHREAIFRDTEPNPFVKFRKLFHSYHVGRNMGLTDEEYVSIVRDLDDKIASVDGRGFQETPFRHLLQLSYVPDSDVESTLWVKDETSNVARSHKARHLMAVSIWLEVIRRIGWVHADETLPPLAVSSCGNAALAAAVLAKAMQRTLRVFVPPDADRSVVQRLEDLGASLTTCGRDGQRPGDPCYKSFREAIDDGAVPFSCQGNVNGLVIEGGQTLTFEIVAAILQEELILDRVFVQVGGGALASSCIQAFLEAQEAGLIEELPRIYAVQTENVAPLRRAYDRIVERIIGRIRSEDGNGGAIPESDQERAEMIRARISSPLVGEELRYAATHRSEFMWPWEEEPESIASAILDDETYDWYAVVRGMLRTGGFPVVISEEALREANDIGCFTAGVQASPTGTAGLAACLKLFRSGVIEPGENVAVMLTGVQW